VEFTINVAACTGLGVHANPIKKAIRMNIRTQTKLLDFILNAPIKNMIKNWVFEKH
jgi:hypothetical protein